MKKEFKKEDVLKICKEKNVKFIRLFFSDIVGQMKGFSVYIDELERALEDGMGFDGSSIKGFARIDESDMIALPDPSTFTILPYGPQEKIEAAMICDILNPDRTPYEGDSRYILKKNLKYAEQNEFRFYVGPELEFFIFKNEKSTEILDEGGYFDVTTLDAGNEVRREIILALEQMGIKVEYAHHEVAPSQYEIDLRYTDALTMADIVMFYRMIAKEIAAKHGLYLTFMPKPIYGVCGSGMHTHQSLFIGDKNVFFDPKDEFYLSDIAKKYIAGLLKHSKEITFICNQWVNSYKRLVPGYEAPVYICWARRNRSTLIRVPMYRPGKEKSTRIEFRSPDPACNPYLAFACMLRAGLKGIENNYDLPEPLEMDVYHLTEEDRKKLDLDVLPGSLIEAIEIAEKSELLKETLGEHIYTNLLIAKKIEWDEYRKRVFEYEIDTYLPIL
ncbi:MAG: glutamine synthetase family protein [Candidatus Omnitrophica bacterium]|nr:glutamine synthetase family protein [Candidatus Omnitrophota bacterium]MCM8810712.1 glutamine synthetase family protein [Candidatus Omnitrophota bacterium]MCM8832924.1 glutamine synthetase family protein [Candidatus Omnitrophota bacterium]